MKINNLETDFEDGVILCALLEQISSKNVGIVNKKAKIRAQKLENTGAALRFLKDEGIKLVAIGPEGKSIHEREAKNSEMAGRENKSKLWEEEIRPKGKKEKSCLLIA